MLGQDGGTLIVSGLSDRTFSTMHQVVIIGGGFGGLHAARDLRRAPVNLTLVDRHNYHLFQPLLYQVATGTLSPANIAVPLRSLLKRQQNTRVLLAEVREIDVAGRRVLFEDGEPLAYDSLIVAAGSTHSYFGNDQWESIAPGLKTIENATAIRAKILLAFEEAERATSAEERAAWLTFVVVGGGPTGVELVGQLGEIAHHTLVGEFRSIDPEQAQIYLIETADRVLPPFPAKLSGKAAATLAKLQVKVLTEARVTDIAVDSVQYEQHGKSQRLVAKTILWAAGVKASPLASGLAAATGAALDRQGRISVGPGLTLPGHDEIYIVGDMAQFEQAPGDALPALAQVAMQEGRYAARAICARLKGQSLAAFRYRDYGTLATVGRHSAVADLHKLKLSGLLGWIVWLFVHLLSLVQFQNRLLVLVQWGWNYFTRNRAARLITGPPTADGSKTANDRDA
jgi:NADH dehydrogenase